MSNLEQNRSNFWYILPLIFAIFGGVIAYFVLRKSDPKKARYCLLIGIGMVVLGIIINVTTPEYNPEIKEKRLAEQQAIRDEYEERTGKKIDLTSSGSFDWESEKLKIEQAKIEQDKIDIEKLTQLPDSCYGVNSIETELYPTGEQCLELLDERIFDFCLAENNDDETKAMTCFTQAYAIMDGHCRDSDEQGLLSISYEVCFMSEMVYAYQNLIPNP